MSLDYLNLPGAFMHHEERELIKNLSAEVASIFNPCNVVHIGVAWGASCYCSRAGAPNAIIYGVDTIGDRDLKGSDEDKKELNLHPLVGDSRVIHKDFHEVIHFLYVDGDHARDTVLSDIINWGGKVAKGGYIAFHDCAECGWAPGVNAAIAEGILSAKWQDLGIAAWSRYFRRI